MTGRLLFGGGNGSKAEVSALPSKYSDVGTRWDSEERARGLHFAFMEFHDARVNQKFRVVRGCGVMGGGGPVRKCVLDGTSALLIRSPLRPSTAGVSMSRNCDEK